jgi:hypothetical protein
VGAAEANLGPGEPTNLQHGLGQCTQEVNAKLKRGDDWTTVLDVQDGVGLLKVLHRLYNQQDGWKMGLAEIVTLQHSLALVVQGRRNLLDYLQAFKATPEAINLAGGYASDSITAAKIVVMGKD